MKKILTFIFVAASLSAMAQPADKSATDTTVFHYVERMPEFHGNMGQYLGENIRYPDSARENNIQGRVIVRFVVMQDGTVADATIVRGIGGGCDEEALRVVKAMDKWTPGMQNGKLVNVYYNLPVVFILEEEKKKK